VLAGSRLNVSQQRALAAQRAIRVLGCMENSITSWSKRGGYPAVFSLGAASPGIPCAVLGPAVEERCEGA